MCTSVLLSTACALLLPHAGAAAPDYPRIANLWGCSPESTDYDEWARYDLLVMSGGGPDSHRRFRREVRARNPEIILLGTAPLMNIGSPESTPWMREEWYLHRADGSLVRWWADQICAPNLMIDECLDALVGQTERTYGELLSGGDLDGVFYDSVVGSATWYGPIDTDGDGRADDPADINPKWHARQCLFLDRLRERWPGMLILANDVDLDHAPHLHGRLFEGGPLLDRVTSGSLAAADVVRVLDQWLTGSVQPGITFAIMTHPLGWQGWRVGKGREVTTPGEVERVRRDFRRMRTGLLAGLMTDAYYAYDFGTVWYGLPFWYAEYDAPLGPALGPAREVAKVPPIPVLDWQAGEPAEAIVLDPAARATPEGIAAEVTEEGGWRRLVGTDPKRLPLEPGKTYRIRAECQVLAKPSQTFQFNVRTATGGWEHHDKGVLPHAGAAGESWTIDVTIVPDEFDDYSVEWHLLGQGGLLLKSLQVELVGETYLIREFAGGVAVLNTTAYPIEVELERPFRRLRDDAAPRHVLEVDDHMADFRCDGAWEMRGGEGHYAGPSHRVARKPGDTAVWAFTAPADDTYTVLACIPGSDEATDAAAYSVAGQPDGPAMTIDQRQGDGGWVELFEVPLTEGRRCEVTLRSGGAGLTAADALRIESRARLNDGAVAQRLTLDPNDGAVLLRE